MSWINLVGYAASASVLATFLMSTMVPLRAAAICSNLLFATFGALAHIYPVLILHAILFPVNVFRFIQLLAPVKGFFALAAASTLISPLAAATQLRQTKPDADWSLIRGWVAEWRRRARLRRELAELIALGERDLRETGLTRVEALCEANKPLWER